jgi:hypothetical protein
MRPVSYLAPWMPIFCDGSGKSGFCADGHCCNAPCDAVCVSCFNDEGDCKNIPKYQSDPWPPSAECIGGYLCNGGGECRRGDGAMCMASIECVSTKCINMTCVP